MTELQTMPLRFRVWDKESKKFCIPSKASEGYELIYVNDGDYGYPIDLVGKMVEKLGDNAVISQDTGLKDKNGKSIFLFDIVKDKNGRLYEVLYAYGGVYVIHDSPRVGLEEETLYRKIYHEGGVEIVGNIWQNSELLEGEE